LPPQPYGLHTPIILVDISSAGRILGLIVDSVEDVLNVTSKELELTHIMLPAELAEQMADRAAYLAGVAKVDRQIILVLNVAALLTPVTQQQFWGGDEPPLVIKPGS